MIVRNSSANSPARRVRVGGRAFVACPVVMSIGGRTLSSGKFCPSAVMAAAAPSFEGKPVTIAHTPKGLSKSARTAWAERNAIGRVRNVRFVANRLVGEALLDVSRAAPELLAAVLRGDRVDVSIGHEPTHRNGRVAGTTGHHLAVLTTRRGHFTVNDGCGLNQPVPDLNPRKARCRCGPAPCRSCSANRGPTVNEDELDALLDTMSEEELIMLYNALDTHDGPDEDGYAMLHPDDTDDYAPDDDDDLLPLPAENHRRAGSDDPDDDLDYVYAKGDLVDVLVRRKGSRDVWHTGTITGQGKDAGGSTYVIVDVGKAHPIRVRFGDLRPAKGKHGESRLATNSLYIGADPLPVTNDQGEQSGGPAVWTDWREWLAGGNAGKRSRPDRDEVMRENRRRLGLRGDDPLPLPGEHPFAAAQTEGGRSYSDHLRRLATNSSFEGDDVLPY